MELSRCYFHTKPIKKRGFQISSVYHTKNTHKRIEAEKNGNKDGKSILQINEKCCMR